MGHPVVGTTVSPYGVFELCHHWTSTCSGCSSLVKLTDYVTVCYPQGFVNGVETREPLPAYLGSKTTKSKNLFHPWEKESVVPPIDRAA